MTVSIHQPHFLPWLGYFNKALHSDVFVWLDTVQYRKNYFQNRTVIKNINGEPLWLTLPVHAKLGMPIAEVRIADAGWCARVNKTIDQCYRKAPYFSECWPSIGDALAGASDSLDDINYRTFSAVLGLLGVGSMRVEKARDIPTKTSDPTLRLVEICQTLGATRYIAGKGGKNYLETDKFEKAGIEVVWQAFDPSMVTYHQPGKAFLPGLSVVDCLLNAGPNETRKLGWEAWVP